MLNTVQYMFCTVVILSRNTRKCEAKRSKGNFKKEGEHDKKSKTGRNNHNLDLKPLSANPTK